MTLNYNYYKILIYFFPLAVIQVTLLPFLSVDTVGPDLIIILLVYYTLQYGQIFGMLAGFALGFLFDLISGGVLGGFMFSKTLTFFIIGYIYNENKIEEYIYSYWFVLIVLIAGILDSLIYSMIVLSGTSFNLLTLLFTQSILPGLYTAAVSVPFLLFRKRKGLR